MANSAQVKTTSGGIGQYLPEHQPAVTASKINQSQYMLAGVVESLVEVKFKNCQWVYGKSYDFLRIVASNQ